MHVVCNREDDPREMQELVLHAYRVLLLRDRGLRARGTFLRFGG